MKCPFTSRPRLLLLSHFLNDTRAPCFVVLCFLAANSVKQNMVHTHAQKRVSGKLISPSIYDTSLLEDFSTLYFKFVLFFYIFHRTTMNRRNKGAPTGCTCCCETSVCALVVKMFSRCYSGLSGLLTSEPPSMHKQTHDGEGRVKGKEKDSAQQPG